MVGHSDRGDVPRPDRERQVGLYPVIWPTATGLHNTPYSLKCDASLRRAYLNAHALPQRSAPLYLLTQLGLQDLSAGIAWKRFAPEHDILRHFEVGDAFAGE